MQCYHSKHECSICFVKVYLIPLVLVSQPCLAFFFKRTWLGHACKSVPDMSSVRHRYNTSNEVSVLPTFIYIFEGVWYIFPLIKSPVPLPVPLIITSSNTPRRMSMIMFCCSFSFTFFFPLQPIFLLTLVSTF